MESCSRAAIISQAESPGSGACPDGMLVRSSRTGIQALEVEAKVNTPFGCATDHHLFLLDMSRIIFRSDFLTHYVWLFSWISAHACNNVHADDVVHSEVKRLRGGGCILWLRCLWHGPSWRRQIHFKLHRVPRPSVDHAAPLVHSVPTQQPSLFIPACGGWGFDRQERNLFLFCDNSRLM